MEEGLIKITPDQEKAKSILKMVDTTLEMIEVIDHSQFSSNVIKEYYDVIRELISIILLLDGYKTYGEGAHKKLIEYLRRQNLGFTEYEISLIDELRITRNKVAYDGFFIERDYVEMKRRDIQLMVSKLKDIIKKKL